MRRYLLHLSSMIARIPYTLMKYGYYRWAVIMQTIKCFIRPSSASISYLSHLEIVRHINAINRSRGEGNDYLIYVINRDRDNERLKAFDARSKKLGFSYSRISAIDCAEANFNFRQFEKEIGNHFYGGSVFMRSGVGCFLESCQGLECIYGI